MLQSTRSLAHATMRAVFVNPNARRGLAAVAQTARGNRARAPTAVSELLSRYVKPFEAKAAAARAAVPHLPRPEVVESLLRDANTRSCVLIGPAGSGKSTLLNEITEHFRANAVGETKGGGAFVFRIPSAKDVLSGRSPYNRVAGASDEDKSDARGNWDLPNESVTLLTLALKENEEASKKTTRERHLIGPLESIFKGEEAKGVKSIRTGSTSLQNLISEGSKNPKIATSIVLALIRELAHFSHGVIAVDDINAAFGETAYHDEESRKLCGKSFVLFDAIADIMAQENALPKVYGAATSRIFWGEAPQGYPEQAHLAPATPFTVKQIGTLVESMREKHTLTYPLDPKRLLMCTGGIPGRVIDMCMNPHMA